MSEERNLEMVYHHRASQVDGGPWHGASPDAELMAREEAVDQESTTWLVATLLVYLFADGQPWQWRCVGERVLAVIREILPGMLIGRGAAGAAGGGVPSDQSSVISGKTGALGPDGKCPGYALEELVGMCEANRRQLRVLMEYLFPDGPEWLRVGCKRVYLLARRFSPALVSEEGRELSYEDYARIFGEGPVHTDEEKQRARSRWSARAQELLRKPVESSGGKMGCVFGKSAEAREASRVAALGNTNRRKVPPGGGVIGEQ